MAHIIVLGNEKGGSGKTTTAMHLIISLLKLDFKVATIDLDLRQQSLTRYLDNRKKTADKDPTLGLAMPEHFGVKNSDKINKDQASVEEEQNFMSVIEPLKSYDFIVIDTPGSDSFLSRLAHSHADTVITPINDSFVDLDLIGNINIETMDSVRPGIYSAMLWEQRMKRAARVQLETNWIVVRNRLSTLDAINKRNIEMSLKKLAKRFGFKIAPGFGDRVVFKELFLLGLTLHDASKSAQIRMSTSVIAARQELREFVKSLGIREIGAKFSNSNDVGSEESIDKVA